MKRFTDSEKWRDRFFRKLPPIYKLFLCYLFDNCDALGYWEPDMELASQEIGHTVTEAEAIQYLADRIEVLPAVPWSQTPRWKLTRFVAFQYGGVLNPDNKFHKGVINLAIARGIPLDSINVKASSVNVAHHQPQAATHAPAPQKSPAVKPLPPSNGSTMHPATLAALNRVAGRPDTVPLSAAELEAFKHIATRPGLLEEAKNITRWRTSLNGDDAKFFGGLEKVMLSWPAKAKLASDWCTAHVECDPDGEPVIMKSNGFARVPGWTRKGPGPQRHEFANDKNGEQYYSAMLSGWQNWRDGLISLAPGRD